MHCLIKYIKKYIFYILSLIILIVINIALNNYKNHLNSIYIPLKRQLDIVKKLSKEEINFIKNHSLNSDAKKNIINYVILLKKFYGSSEEVEYREILKEQMLGRLKVSVIEFNSVFLHDKFIFELVKAINSYKDGLIRVSSLQIIKNSSNKLKTKMLCELYQLAY